MGKADIFIADAHIKNMDTPCAKRLMRFLDHIKGKTRRLYILGDLFDFWFGDKSASFKIYGPILNKLKELSDGSVEIIYLEGNHDFFMGSFFTETLKAKVFSDEAYIDADSKKLYLTHGDLINYEDKAHLLWRRILRSKLLYFIMKVLPSRLLYYIAGKLSKKSRGYSKDKKGLKQELLDELLTGLHEKGISTVIYAHTHTPLIKENEAGVIVNPGAFVDNGSYVRYMDGTFTLENFTL